MCVSGTRSLLTECTSNSKCNGGLYLQRHLWRCCTQQHMTQWLQWYTSHDEISTLYYDCFVPIQVSGAGAKKRSETRSSKTKNFPFKRSKPHKPAEPMAIPTAPLGHALLESSTPKLSLQVFLDYTCPHCKRLYINLHENVLPFCASSAVLRDQVRLHAFTHVQPWHAQGSLSTYSLTCIPTLHNVLGPCALSHTV